MGVKERTNWLRIIKAVHRPRGEKRNTLEAGKSSKGGNDIVKVGGVTPEKYLVWKGGDVEQVFEGRRSQHSKNK